MLQTKTQGKQYFFRSRILKKDEPLLKLRIRTNNNNHSLTTNLRQQSISPISLPKSQFYPSNTRNNIWIEYNKQKLQKKIVPAMKNFWHKIRSNSPNQVSMGNMDILIGFRTINFKKEFFQPKQTKQQFLRVKKKSMSQRKTHFLSNNNQQVKLNIKRQMNNTGTIERPKISLGLPFIKQYSSIKGWDAQYHEQKNQNLQQPSWQ